MLSDFLTSLIDANTLGGWVRAGVASVAAVLLSKNSTLAGIVGPDMVTAAGVLISGVVVGIWSHLVKAQAAATAPKP